MRPPPAKDWRHWLTLWLITIVSYGVLGKICMELGTIGGTASPFWLPAGLVVALSFVYGYRVLPGIFISQFLFATLFEPGASWKHLLLATGNLVEGAVVCYLAPRLMRGRDPFASILNFFSILISTAVGSSFNALIGSAALLLSGMIPAAAFASVMLNWSIGDLGGMLIITPLILAWQQTSLKKWQATHVPEQVLVLLIVTLITYAIFGGLYTLYSAPMAFFLLPLLLWSAFRFEIESCTLLNSLMMGIVIWGTTHGHGPFVTESPTESLILIQAFTSVIIMTSLIAFIVNRDRRRMMLKLLHEAERLEAKVALRTTRLSKELNDRRELEASLRKLSLAVEQSPSSIVITDLEANIEYVNASFTRVTGYTQEEILGHNPRLLNSGNTPREIYEAMWATLNCGQVWKGEFINRRKDGSDYPEMAMISPVRQPDGTVTHYLAIMDDITERKQNEAIILLAKEAAESLARSKSEFLANMSHEIRTPMNGIIGLSHLALNQPVSSAVRDYLEKINSSSESLLGILNDILDFSKMEAGKLAIASDPFNLNTLLNNLHSLFHARAEEKHLVLDIQVADAIPTTLVGDAMRLQQVLANLLGNALKFTEHGTITLAVQLMEQLPEKARIRVSVSDTGIGISGENQAKLFMPFSQADATITRRFGGTGLGLAISQKLLALMDSHIEVESAPRQGTRFWFDLTLGVAPNEPPPALNPQRQADALGQDLRRLGQGLAGKRILVAEDNQINQQVVREFLKLSGVLVDIANNGIEALELLNHNAYDAVLMDVHMPLMGGIEATEIIRQRPPLRALPVIALTAGVTQEERDKCLACGMNDFIAKPILPDQLISTLRQWLA